MTRRANSRIPREITLCFEKNRRKKRIYALIRHSQSSAGNQLFLQTAFFLLYDRRIKSKYLTHFAQTNIIKMVYYSVYTEYEVQSLNGYITTREAAKKWGVTSRQVQILCKENRVPGASRMSRIWIIPEDAKKPTDIRHSKGRRTD